MQNISSETVLLSQIHTAAFRTDTEESRKCLVLPLSQRYKLRQGHCKCQSLYVLLRLLCPNDIFVPECGTKCDIRCMLAYPRRTHSPVLLHSFARLVQA